MEWKAVNQKYLCAGLMRILMPCKIPVYIMGKQTLLEK